MKNKILMVFLISGLAAVFIMALILMPLYFREIKNSPLADSAGLAEKNKNENGEIIKMAAEKNSGPEPINSKDHSIGDKGALIKIIIYSDFECPFCARFESTIKKIKSEFGDKVLIVFRHFPMRFHAQAMTAALVSECASEQEKFWEMHDKLFENNVNKNLNAEQFKKDAENLGLNMKKFNLCLEKEKYREEIEKQKEEGTRSGVTGTPTIFINNKIFPGAYPFEDFISSIGEPKKGLRSIINEILK
jgi:protein-disulfide isomerase